MRHEGRRGVWQALASSPRRDGSEYVLLYDDGCGFCARWMRWAVRRPVAQLRFEPCQTSSVREAAGIAPGLCAQSAFLVQLRQGRPVKVLSGAAAINGVLARFEGRRSLVWRWLSHAYRIPGIRQAQNLGYRWVARNRHRFGSRSCDVAQMRALSSGKS